MQASPTQGGGKARIIETTDPSVLGQVGRCKPAGRIEDADGDGLLLPRHCTER
jgi:hypothetical protein